MGELYGEFNALTQEWHDGLASTIMRESVSDPTEDQNWTVFDGPIDALWIENMNTVLDDNMTLCLANGERIKLRTQMRMVFEVMDLAVASPATVSRIGVVYMTPSDLGWKPFVQTWLAATIGPAVSPGCLDRLTTHSNCFIEPGINYVRANCTEPVPTVDINLVVSFCRLFESLFLHQRTITTEQELLVLLDRVFVFSFIWYVIPLVVLIVGLSIFRSIGASSETEQRAEFDLFSRDLFENGQLLVRIPPSRTLYDYFVDMEDNSFRLWSEIIPAFNFDRDVPYFQMLVPTPDNIRYNFLIRNRIRFSSPCYITGVTGSGKTVVIQNLLRELQCDSDAAQKYLAVTLNFSAQTSSLVTQNTIEGKLEKKRKNLLGPPGGSKMVIFVDDINMPAVEEYGAQPPIELIRQFLDFKGMYDRDKLYWKEIAVRRAN